MSKDFKNQESDVVYKLKEKSVYFLIEHQTKIDYRMPLRILEYSTEIIRGAIDYNRFGNKNYKLTLVIPIVLYTGNKKWDVKNYIKDVQEKLDGVSGLEYAKYNLVDVNEYTEKELLEHKSFITKAMLLEKATSDEELIKYTEKIIDVLKNNGDIYNNEIEEIFISIINLILNRKIGNKKSQELIKRLKGDDGEMLAVLDMIDRENMKIYKKGRTEGKKEGKKEGKIEALIDVAKKMINEKLSIEKIIEITGLNKEEIEKLK